MGELGVSFIETSVSTAKDLENLRLCPTDGPCISVKTAFSHSADLLARGVDALFVPSIVSLEPGNYCCPKMMGLPSMLKAGFELPDSRMISPVIDIKDSPGTWESTWIHAGRKMGAGSNNRIRNALRKALIAWRQAEQDMQRFGLPVRRLLDDWRPSAGVKENCFHLNLEYGQGPVRNKQIAGMAASGSRVSAPTPRGLDPRKTSGDKAPISNASIHGTTAIMGHAYLLNDTFGHTITRYASSCGPVILPEMVSRDKSREHLQTIFEGEKMWTIEGHILGACLYLIRNRKVGRLILVTAFSCGPLSIIENYMMPEAEKYGIPVLYLSVDEHTGEAGLITRLEAFIDSCKARQVSRGCEISKELAPKPSPASLGPSKSPVGIVTMGHLDISLSALMREFGVDVRIPGTLSDDMVNAGKELAPEFICYPMVTLLGQMRALIDEGVSRIIMVQGKGKCRLGWYAQIMEKILHRAGYPVKVLAFDSPFPLRSHGRKFFDEWKQIVGTPTLTTIIRALALTLQKQVLVDRSQDILREVRARERVRGTGDKRHRVFLKDLDRASQLSQLKKSFDRYNRDMKRIPFTSEETLKVAIVGEIYVVNEPFVNKDAEKMLGSFEQRVRVYRKLDVTGWLNCHIFKTPRALWDYRRATRAAGSYLPVDVGGHGQESVGEAVLASASGMDGVLHLFPFTCMPEIIAQSILVKVSNDLDIPVLSLMISEQTGVAGLRTRLEAFCDLLEGRKKSLART